MGLPGTSLPMLENKVKIYKCTKNVLNPWKMDYNIGKYYRLIV